VAELSAFRDVGEEMPAILVVLGGLPGTGKTTVARQLAAAEGATYLRIDDIEQAMRVALGLGEDIGPAGYMIAYALADSNLRLGRTVVADSVNPIELTRAAWRSVAENAGKPILEVEFVCSNTVEHRRRVETRTAEIPGSFVPDWSAVLARDYEPWPGAKLVVDTARMTAREAASLISAGMRALK
jgi:predicted kinase